MTAHILPFRAPDLVRTFRDLSRDAYDRAMQAGRDGDDALRTRALDDMRYFDEQRRAAEVHVMRRDAHAKERRLAESRGRVAVGGRLVAVTP
jgi:hypothetical protein